MTVFAITEKGGLTMAKFKNPLVTERKPPSEPIYHIKKSQLESMLRAELNKGLHAGVYSANAMYTAALLFKLHDTLGWGQQRLKRIHERVQKLFESIADRTVNYAEIAEVLRDECEINLVIERPDDTAVNALDMFLTMADADRKAHAVKIR